MGLVETFIVCLGPILVLFSALSWLAYYYYYYLGWPQRESIDLADRGGSIWIRMGHRSL